MSVLLAIWSFFGVKWFFVIPSWYVCLLIGANSPATFKRSRAGLERIANAALAKARGKTG